MMRIGGAEPEALRVGRRAVMSLYVGARLVWESVRQWWRGIDAWRGSDAW